jgi:hypothetical protein
VPNIKETALPDHSVRGEGDFNEQERRTLENATTGWWKSNGVDFTSLTLTPAVTPILSLRLPSLSKVVVML